jgi:hypothetical protein
VSISFSWNVLGVLTFRGDDLIMKHHGIKSIPKPSKLSYESVLNYIWKNKPLVEGHEDFVFLIKDFVRLGLRSQNDQLHDRLVRWISCWPESPLNVRLLPIFSALQINMSNNLSNENM